MAVCLSFIQDNMQVCAVHVSKGSTKLISCRDIGRRLTICRLTLIRREIRFIRLRHDLKLRDKIMKRRQRGDGYIYNNCYYNNNCYYY